MPQCISGNWKFKDIPYGKGSRSGDSLDAIFRHRRRAAKINEAEKYRCGLTKYMIDKNQRSQEDRNGKVMGRLRKSIEEINAYQQVLESYRADNFQTMRWGFQARQANTPKSFQRTKLERRIYYCGFSPDTLRPEVTQAMYNNRPEVRRRVAHTKLLAAARQRSDFMIDRQQTNEGLFHERTNTILGPISPSREKSTVEITKRLLSNL